MVKFSTSVGIGIAGTVEVYVNDGGEDVLRGYRGAFSIAVALSGLGFLFSVYYIFGETGAVRTARKG